MTSLLPRLFISMAAVIAVMWIAARVMRNRQTPGRGNATYAGFKLEENWKDLPAGKAGRVTSEDYWERITYFLTRAVPVAKQYDVRLACHPYDPPGLPFGYQGADNWDSPSVFAAIKRYEAIVESPYNGFQLCLGTTAEGLKNPRTEVLPIVEYLGKRGKIHQIHMRNIRGGLGDFQEVYPDEGEMDFLEVMRILRDTQFTGSICPDHMPRRPDDPGLLQERAPGADHHGDGDGPIRREGVVLQLRRQNRGSRRAGCGLCDHAGGAGDHLRSCGKEVSRLQRDVAGRRPGRGSGGAAQVSQPEPDGG